MIRVLAFLVMFATLRTPLVAEARAGAGPASATQSSAPTVNHRDFAAGFQAAESLRSAGDFLDAARKWRETASLLPETREYMSDRANLHRYMVEDYVKALSSTSDVDLLREAIRAIDEYTTRLVADFPDQAVSNDITGPRAEFEERLRVLETPPVTDPSPPTLNPTEPPPAPPSTRDGRPLRIVGGASIGVGAMMLLTLVPVGYTRAREAQGLFEATTGCEYDNPVGECVGIKSDHLAGRSMFIAGWVVGPAFLAAGVTMLVVGTRPKRAERALVPTISRNSIGLSWQGRF